MEMQRCHRKAIGKVRTKLLVGVKGRRTNKRQVNRR
jgi:hypothetical protein